MIEGFIGRPGSGKTYTMTARALKRSERYELVAANYKLDVPNFHRLASPADLLDLGGHDGKKVLVLLDEVHLWLPSRLSMKLPPSLMMRLSQTRKAGWDCWYSAQHETRVDRVLRDVTNWMWLCSAWFGDPPSLFTAKCWEPEKFRKKDKHHTRTMRRFTMDVASRYDTTESLEVAEHVAAVKDFYRDRKAEGDS